MGGAPDQALVNGDADELRSVLSNLLDNAVKYSPDQVKVAIEVTVPEEDLVRVRVSDQGVGIPQAQLKRIFRRFHRFQWRGSKVKGTSSPSTTSLPRSPCVSSCRMIAWTCSHG